MRSAFFALKPLAVALALLGGAELAGAQNIGRADRSFVEQTARDGLAEVQAARVAKEKAASEPVRQFAERMIADHGQANDKLAQIASAKGVALPTDPGPQHRRSLEQLGKTSGARFDQAYMQQMVADHQKAVAAFRKEAGSGGDADVKRFASDSLPTLQEHLSAAQALAGNKTPRP